MHIHRAARNETFAKQKSLRMSGNAVFVSREIRLA